MSTDGQTGLEIAVVAMACRFPGADGPEPFWSNLAAGVESVTRFSDEELRAAGVSHERLADPHYVKASAILDQVDHFDAAFFGLNPREAELLDPQHRIFLETAWEAFEVAGHDPKRYSGRGGVFAGCGLNTYLFQLLSNKSFWQGVDGYQLSIAADKDHLATQVGYKLNLRGPSVVVQTACSTSLVAIHLACQSLLNGECDLALAGGVSLNIPQHRGYLHRPGSILSPDGHCRAFDADAQGIVIGGGCGVVALKRLEDALEDRDRVRAVVKGSAINNDGAAKVGYTAPSVEGQAAVIQAAHLMAEIEPSSVSYIEAHGTGTEMGDSIEIAGLQQAFASGENKDSEAKTATCALGSVKSNLGHLDAAAGVAGFIKTVLALEHRQLPPSLHVTTPNPKLEGSPFKVNTRLRPWSSGGGPRRAGVSSFGIGGTNAHIVLEEAPQLAAGSLGRPHQLLVLSARTASALEATTERLIGHLKEHCPPEADVAYTLQTGRRIFEHRRYLVFRQTDDLIAGLRKPDPRRDLRQAPANRTIAFLFPGQGSQYPGMGKELYAGEEVYRKTLDHCAEILEPHLDFDLRPSILSPDKPENAARLARTELTQPALFCVEYAMARLWMSWGIKPQAFLGHSLGEWVAACLAGVFSLESALRLVALRGRLMQRMPSGAMLAVPMAAAEIEPLLRDRLSIAAINAPQSTVVSGPAAAVEALSKRLAKRQVEARPLHTSHAFHSRMMEPVVEPFSREIGRCPMSAPKIPFLSNVSGDWITPEQACDPLYWAGQVCSPVRFAEGAEHLLAEPDRLLVEVGPGHTLCDLLRQQRVSSRRTFSSLRHPRETLSDWQTIYEALGGLWAAGAQIDWPGVHRGESRNRVALPAYPFERQRYWIEGGNEEPRWLATPVGSVDLAQPSADDLQSLGAQLTGGHRSDTLEAFTEVVAALDKLGTTLGIDPASFDLRLTSGEAAGRMRLFLDRPARTPNPVSKAPSETPTEAPPELYDRPEVPTPYRAPRTDLERRLVESWQRLLAIEPVGIDDHFFDLGGHSLLATQAISQIRQDFAIEVELRRFLECSTIAAMAEEVEPLLSAAGATTFSETSPLKVSPLDLTTPSPLSFAQERLWFLTQLDGDSSAYNLPNVLRMKGFLDKPTLHLALAEVVRRHMVLRSAFLEVAEEPRQIVTEEARLNLPEIDLTKIPMDEQEARVRRTIITAASQPIDLAHGLLLRLLLLRLSDEEHVFVVVFHHIVSDGWSIGVFYEEVARVYNAFLDGAESPLSPLPIQYRDFALWQRNHLQGSVLAELEEYWTSALEPLHALELPTDYPRPAVFSYRGASVDRWFDGELSRSLRQLAKKEDATLFMTLLTHFVILLHQRSGQTEIVVGTDIANRNRQEIEGLIGFFVNQLVLRTSLSNGSPANDPTFLTLLRAVKETTLDAYQHQDLPFERMVELLNPPRDRSRSPLFQVKLTLQNGRHARQKLRGLEIEPLEIHNRTAKLDLLFDFTDFERGLLLICEYSTDLYLETTVERLINDFERLAAAVVTAPTAKLSELVKCLRTAEHEQRQAAVATADATLRERFARLTPRPPITATHGAREDE